MRAYPSRIWRVLLSTVDHHESRIAISAPDEVVTYDEFVRLVSKLAYVINSADTNDRSPIAIFGNKNVSHYVSILSAIAVGRPYVPINPSLPLQRIRYILELTECKVAIMDEQSRQKNPSVVAVLPTGSTLILPQTPKSTSLEMLHLPTNTFTADDISDAPDEHSNIQTKTGEYMYILFTSGSTGRPKGVPIKEENVMSYIEYVTNLYNFSFDDRFTQISPTTFDLSVHDMFVCWLNGGTLLPITSALLRRAYRYLNDMRASAWLSVPSVAIMMNKHRPLTPKSLPALRVSLFCGEVLSENVARLWQTAASNSVVENLYGPTECTIAVTRYRWNQVSSPADCHNGIVPIGYVFDGHNVELGTPFKHENHQLLHRRGELFVSGPQVGEGYWQEDAAGAATFFDVDGKLWYRTGDIVSQEYHGMLRFHGRMDGQLKIHGFRLETEEIEGVLKTLLKTDLVYVLPWRILEGVAQGIVALVEDTVPINEPEILGACKQYLADYMIPDRIFVIDAVPFNEHGKVDRQQLTRILNELES